ncbi:DNA polymerase III subunit gamma/tau [Clostridium botulinum]|uniref:DNA-directed DNA polymerase n=1 Tax=Clostridium botulinum (strain Langeland / NCTC 10281 / Type F) TaxID=441772 RepID=A7G9D3_CLOBL|nr:DNA polymerase III subunit gamma/tau [Clostridium botulinum]ABS42455.1 DNA polymerase III, gamma and tau subunit [Clostridium botulinum F str. Langeland]ADF97878.1 DNA polymerase III, gamma and tau subunit [Clostridium botulinum F str. 230613]KKM43736.1 DNA polymerase III subunit gamma/tau [Clostridium botulinum]MBY6794587.1 DNA polymerase III subunit gamma/tau [Clostridium botulinum]MBY6939344.1 DNA polymerase III subunit gamma/tau [Clostridium botulinum]
MGYTALYREWRPRTFKEVVGQKHITVTLKNQVIEKRIAHAYLFCGTRGTGKTSTAKILSKAVNCLNPKDGEPCNECEICNKINSGTLMDVIEMDAASKRKLEDIKEVIENVKYPPQEGKNKVYIMDEVHMLTQEAVNAFLKTLEEPPSNVIFILATTDPQKLPITILSRCQRFDFRRIRNEEIFERLRAIVSEQGIYADDKSLNLIARMSDGAMRDALSILDQVISTGDGKVEYDQVLDMLGLVTNENLLRITDSIIEKDVEKSMRIIEDIVLSGKDIYNFIKDMITHLRNILMVKVSKNPNEILDMSSENIDLVKEQSEKIRIEEIMRNIKILQEAEQQSKWVKQNRIYLELAVLKMCKIEYDTSKEVILSRLNKIEELIKSGNIKLAINEEKKKIEPKEFNLKREKESMQHSKIEKNSLEDYNKDSKLTVETVKKMWHDILEAFKARRLMVLYAALVTANITDCKEGIITLNYNKQYSFNKKRLEKPENNKVVQEIFSEVLKEKIRIIYIVEEKAKEENLPEEILKNTFGENILEIIDE